MKKKVMALLLAAAMAASMVGCSSSTSSSSAASSAADSSAASTTAAVSTKKDSVRVSLTTAIEDLSPVATATTYQVQLLIYEPLLTYGYDNVLTPKLAKSWEWVDDTHVRFHLQEGVKFTNGADFTSKDVIYSLQLLQCSQSKKTNFCTSLDIDNCVADDDYTVTLALTGHDNLFLGDMTLVMMADSDSNIEDLITNPVGTGNYKLDSIVTGSTITLTRNENYWGEQGNLDGIEFKVISEAAQRSIELETGGVEVIGDLQATDYARLKEDSNYTIINAPSKQNVIFGYNCHSESVCSNLKLRQAMAYAIDASAINNTVYGGMYQVATTYFSAAYSDYQEKYNTPLYEYNLEKAKELLKEAGYSEGELTLRFIVGPDKLQGNCTEVIGNMLSQIGINVTISSYETAVYNTTIKDATAWDICVGGTNSPSALSVSAINNQLGMTGSNKYGMDSQEFQDTMQAALVAADDATYQADVDKLVEMFNENIWYYPLVNKTQIMAYSNTLAPFNLYCQYYVNPATVYWK